MALTSTTPIRVEKESILDLQWIQQNTVKTNGKRLPSYTKLILKAVKKMRREMERKAA